MSKDQIELNITGRKNL